MSKDSQLPPVSEPGSQPDAGSVGVPAEGMSEKGKSDAGQSVDLSKFVPVEDLNKLRSRMDRQISDQNKRFEDLNAQYKALLEWREKNETEGLSDEEMAVYLSEKAQYEANQKVAETQRSAAQLEYEKNFLLLKQYYLSKGAPQSIIQLEDPAEMQEAFLNHLVERATKAEALAAKASQPTDKDTKPAPTVTTHKPAAVSLGKSSWSKVRPGSKEESDLFAALESGAIKPEDIET